MASKHLIERPRKADSIMVAGLIEDEAVDDGVNIVESTKSAFAKFVSEPGNEQRQVVPVADIKMLPAGRLLHWLINFWEKPTVTARNIYQFGPHGTRKRETASSSVKILEDRGWIIPVKAPRHDQRKWLIVRELSQ
jgi:hypothetical protein